MIDALGKPKSLALSAVILAGLAFAGLVHAAKPPLPLDEYWQRMEETRALVANLPDEPPEASLPRLLAAAVEWEAVTQVALPDGTVVPVDHSFLVAQLRADPPDLARLDALLAGLLAARDTWPQQEVTPADMQALDHILARPEFQWQPEQPSPLEEWWEQLQRLIEEFLENLLPGVASDTLLSTLLSYALTGLGALALILVLAYAMRGLLADFVAEQEINAQGDGGDEDLTAATALERAQALSGEGDYRAAVRYLYLSSLLLLEERGLLRYDRSQTNREYVRSVAHRPQLAATLRNVVEVFDRVWYGYQPLDETTYTRYADQVAALRQQKPDEP